MSANQIEDTTAENIITEPQYNPPHESALDIASRMALPLANIGDSMEAISDISLPSALPETPIGVNATTAVGGGISLPLMQTSPPPHSYRHSRAYRHFKNPPQPHMCIRTTTEAGEELFINVLSWTRIVIPQEPSDPIPLYGGMRVPPGSPRSPPIVFAVMANPEVLKDSGRHSKDPEERRAMVELMCDFVEAMNPGVKLIRNAVILKDRDISGELKDVWNAVQAQRDREREEQLMQQRQQQHYHNITTQQMFPKSTETAARLAGQLKSTDEEVLASSPSEQVTAADNATSAADATVAPDFDSNKMCIEGVEPCSNSSDINSYGKSNHIHDNITDHATNGDDSRTTMGITNCGKTTSQNGIESNDQIDATSRTAAAKHESNKSSTEKTDKTANASKSSTDNPTQTVKHKNTTTPTSPTSPTNATSATHAITAATNQITTTNTLTTAAAVVPPPPPTKKDKLGGFLPNGCIFPRFKHNKHKDKDKDKDKEKEKETKSKDKEKTLLNALKKSKEKKVAPVAVQTEKALTATDADTKTQYEKNCINLESEVQKLDLNKIDTTTGNDNMFIKLKVAATSAAAK